jgi:citrate lyase subunit beta/citryl-CoA lyase
VDLPGRARTWLFVPAHRLPLVEKALASRADVVILDLEDSVPATEKSAARAAIVDTLTTPPVRPIVVRVTADDLATDLEAALRPGIAGVMIPKATPSLIGQAHAGLVKHDPNVVFIPMIENATAVEQMDLLVAASPRVRLVAFGSLDFASSVGLRPDEAEDSLDHVRQHVVLGSSRARLLAPIDSPVVALGDTEFVRRRAKRSRRLGFQGMLLIHPEQIEPVREAYRPSEEEVEAARRFVDAYNDAYRAGIGAVRVDDRMIDAANIGMYRRVLAEAASE